jgi:hypothetical protein
MIAFDETLLSSLTMKLLAVVVFSRKFPGVPFLVSVRALGITDRVDAKRTCKEV